MVLCTDTHVCYLISFQHFCYVLFDSNESFSSFLFTCSYMLVVLVKASPSGNLLFVAFFFFFCFFVEHPSPPGQMNFSCHRTFVCKFKIFGKRIFWTLHMNLLWVFLAKYTLKLLWSCFGCMFKFWGEKHRQLMLQSMGIVEPSFLFVFPI